MAETEIVRTALDDEWQRTLDWINQLQDLATAAVASKTLARMLLQWLGELAPLRKEIAQGLAAEGWSNADIALLLDVSRARAGQLTKED